jgi:AcrR family transcriptional regulator
MKTMPRGSPERTEARKLEIIKACEQLYQTMSFKEITLKEIGKETSFSRPTIYNYFQTKEEIFLALYEMEYERWNTDLKKILCDNDSLTREQIAEQIARSLEKRGQLLKLLAMNNYDMESNSRSERLVMFKAAYGRSMKNVYSILDKFCPDMDDLAKERFIYVFFPFMFGIYPYSSVTEKQRQAMKEADVAYKYHSIFEITYQCLIQLLRK